MPSSRPENSALKLALFLRACLAWVALLLVCSVSACAPEIGDECANALDCSASGTRLCDRTQPRGYCTLEGCEEDTCPGEAVCVQFGRRIEGKTVDRLGRSYCMYKCDSNSDCRTDDQYACYSGRTFGSRGEAVVLGNQDQKFCAPAPAPPVAMSMPDAGEPMSMPEDASTSDPDAEPDAATSDAAMSTPDDDAGASE